MAGTPEIHLPHIPLRKAASIAGAVTLGAAGIGLAAQMLIGADRGPQSAPTEPTRASDTLKPPAGPNNSLVSNPSAEATPSAIPVPPTPTREPSPTPKPKPEIQFKTGVNTPVESTATKNLVLAGPENSSRTSIYLSRDPQDNEPVSIKAVWGGDMKVSTFLLGNLLVKHLAITNREGIIADYLFLGDITNLPKPPANSRPVDEGEDIGTITGHMAIEPRIKAQLAQLPDYSLSLSFKQNGVPLDARNFTAK